jgi:hypothetical protein
VEHFADPKQIPSTPSKASPDILMSAVTAAQNGLSVSATRPPANFTAANTKLFSLIASSNHLIESA